MIWQRYKYEEWNADTNQPLYSSIFLARDFISTCFCARNEKISFYDLKSEILLHSKEALSIELKMCDGDV